MLVDLNLETAEIKEVYGTFISDEQKQGYIKKQYEIKTQNDYGAFTWFLYNRTDDIFPNLKQSNITRIMFIATYLNYDGYLSYDNKRANIITKKNMNDLLKLSTKEFYRFYNEMIEQKIFIEKDNKIYLNKKIFTKGETKKLSTDYTRICANGVRALYEQVKPKQHKILAYIFKLLPYINYQYNIVCKNPFENEQDLVKPYTFQDICDFFGIERRNSTKFRNDLLRFTVGEDTMIRFMMLLDRKTNKTVLHTFINPHIYYSGKDYKAVEILGGFGRKAN